MIKFRKCPSSRARKKLEKQEVFKIYVLVVGEKKVGNFVAAQSLSLHTEFQLCITQSDSSQEIVKKNGLSS